MVTTAVTLIIHPFLGYKYKVERCLQQLSRVFRLIDMYSCDNIDMLVNRYTSANILLINTNSEIIRRLKFVHLTTNWILFECDYFVKVLWG